MMDRIDMETMRKRLSVLLREPVEMVPYDPQWAQQYADSERFLRSVLPEDLVLAVQHIGSTSVPGLSAKPVIDVQVEVNDLERVVDEVVPPLLAAGYEFIWRPSIGEREPFYAWFLKRDGSGRRTHHIHMVKPDEASEARVLFRDHLRTNVQDAEHYERVKHELAQRHGNDREAYTKGKTELVAAIVAKARFSAG